ncbi:hypothetical protein [Xanthomonas phage XAJ2]|uniref:Uncharacterized protein n=1 Tax=Xanthomonas phage XAJ2 TaxID=1775249 RepID=A0A1I9L2I1_9CAUD|nr:hypothetical protein [Xanthomonas phage XAJ2]
MSNNHKQAILKMLDEALPDDAYFFNIEFEFTPILSFKEHPYLLPARQAVDRIHSVLAKPENAKVLGPAAKLEVSIDALGSEYPRVNLRIGV